MVHKTEIDLRILWDQFPGSDGYQFEPPRTLQDAWDIAMMRNIPEWLPLPAPAGSTRLIHLGGGNKHIDDWEELDYPEYDAETMDMPYVDNSIHAILSTHALDHISPAGVVNLLREAQRVMVDGGVFTIVVPHFSGQLAMECIEHKSRYGLKTWKNIFGKHERLTRPDPAQWQWEIGFNRIMANEEANPALVTQLIRRPR